MTIRSVNDNGNTGRLAAEIAQRAAAEAARRAAEAAEARAAAEAAQRAAEQAEMRAEQMAEQQMANGEGIMRAHTGPLGQQAISAPPPTADRGFEEFEGFGAGAPAPHPNNIMIKVPAHEEHGGGAPNDQGAGAPPPIHAGGGAPAFHAPDLGSQIKHAVGGVKNTIDTAKNLTSDRVDAHVEKFLSENPELRAEFKKDQEFQRLSEAKRKADSASSIVSIVSGVGGMAAAANEMQHGDALLGAGHGTKAALDTVSAAIKLKANVNNLKGEAMGIEQTKAGKFKGTASTVGAVTDTVQGIKELQDGKVFQGGVHVAAGVIGTVGAAASFEAAGKLGQFNGMAKGMGKVGAELEAFKKEKLFGNAFNDDGSVNKLKMGKFGQLAAPLTVVSGTLTGALSVKSGIDQIRNGDVVHGVANIATGATGTASGVASAVSIMATSSHALEVFGKAAGPLGAISSGIGGGMQVFDAFKKHPPDLKSAAVGGAKVVGSALMLAGPPAAAAGGAILIGTALYENVKPVRDLVNGYIGGEIEVAKGVIKGVGDVAHGVENARHDVIDGFKNAGSELAHGNVIGAAGSVISGEAHAVVDVGKGVVKGVSDVAHGVEKGVERAEKGVKDAGKSIVSGAKSVGKGIGKALSHL